MIQPLISSSHSFSRSLQGPPGPPGPHGTDVSIKYNSISPFNLDPCPLFHHRTRQLSAIDLIPPWGWTGSVSETDTVCSVQSRTPNFLNTETSSFSPTRPLSENIAIFIFSFSCSLKPSMAWFCVVFKSYVMWFNCALPHCNMSSSSLFRNVKFWISSWSSAVSSTLKRILTQMKPHALYLKPSALFNSVPTSRSYHQALNYVRVH